METTSDHEATLFTGARLIIGDGQPPIEDASLLVRDGQVAQIGAANALSTTVEARIVDLSGKTIMPAIVNPHGHIGYMKGAVADKANYSRENVLDHLHRLTYYGVSVFQSLGTDRDDIEISVRNDQRASTLSDPNLALLLTAGTGIVAPTEGSVNGGPFFAADVLHESASAEDARQYVRELAAKKPDAVKFWVDDRWGTKAKLSPDIYAVIIDEAHKHGLKVIAHIFDLEDAKGVVRAGVDGIAHMVREPGPDDEFLALLVTHNVFAFTSMSIQKGIPDGEGWLDDPSLAETVSAEAIATLKAQLRQVPQEMAASMKASYAILEAGLRRYLACGVRVVLSADTGLFTQFPGFAEHRELEAMVQAGMPALEAIRAATQISADVLGLDDRGTLEPGKRADFIVLDANPLDDIANTRKIAAVYLKGEAVDRIALRKLWT
jgi:imidazolonepropionase-like amidohydrolase